MNHLIFIFHTFFISSAALYALYGGISGLIAFICLQTILANLFVTKAITLAGLTATAADAYTIGAVFGFHLLQEFYGKTVAKKAIFISTASMIFVTILGQIHLAYTPAGFDTMHPHFFALLGVMPRIVCASFIAYFISQWGDWFLFSALKTHLDGRFFGLRNVLSASASQLIDTVLFSFLGLYGIVENIGQIIIISYTIKMAALLLSAPFMMVAKAFYSRLPIEDTKQL